MIGFYDSGLGGLTIFKEMALLSPATALYYYADTNNCPLGEKTEQEIFDAVERGVEFLMKKGCTIVLLACNTATVVAIRKFQGSWLKGRQGKNILGIVRPMSENLAEKGICRDSTIAVMATKATIETGFYAEELEQSGYSHHISIACSGLAFAIENNDTKSQKIILQKLFDLTEIKKIKTLVLACTHYPIITELIRSSFIKAGGCADVQILCQNDFVPLKLVDYLLDHPEYKLRGQGIEYFASANPRDFSAKVKQVFGIDIKVSPVLES